MSKRIIIVDDEPNMRLGLIDNLEFEGYQVDFAENGREGLDTSRCHDARNVWV